jgi:hypothetical protein
MYGDPAEIVDGLIARTARRERREPRPPAVDTCARLPPEVFAGYVNQMLRQGTGRKVVVITKTKRLIRGDA